MKKLNSLVLIAMLAVGVSSCTRSPETPGYQYLPDMLFSPAYEAYGENSLTEHGSTMMLPVKGTIARGKMPFTYGYGPTEAERAGRELKNPFAKNAKTMARGEEVYKNFCLVCHGASGKGDGPIIGKFPNPPAYQTERVKNFPEGRLFHVITRGWGLMPSHGEQIDVRDRWYLVQYIQKLQQL